MSVKPLTPNDQVFYGRLAIFDPHSPSPIKAMIYKGDVAWTTKPIISGLFVYSEQEIENLRRTIESQIEHLLPGDKRPIRGLEQLEFLKVPLASVPNFERWIEAHERLTGCNKPEWS
jgi:hypothetical protein